MRLTLRTLLAYLDDTLDAAQSKLIGQKVAESETAQELIRRLKRVTRQRRLTVPPPDPAGKSDPNTVAEYLDNVLSAEETAEIEKLALESDVHLAEIAACHQLLTLLLSEPILIPPSSRQRMYALVKGREAIPFRRPPQPVASEPEAAADLEADETLRLGLPPYRRQGSWSSRLLIIGSSLAAALLLALAVWQALRSLPKEAEEEVTARPGSQPPANLSEQLAPAPGTATPAPKKEAKAPDQGTAPLPPGRETSQKPPAAGTPSPGSQKTPSSSSDQKTPPEKTPPPPEPTQKDKAVVKENTEKNNGAKSGPPAEPVAGPPTKKTPGEPAVEPPQNRSQPVGEYRPRKTAKNDLLLVQAGAGKSWRVLLASQPQVLSGQPLVCLPGCSSEIGLPNGLRLRLWGLLSEQHLYPPQMAEARLVLHDPPAGLALDLTLQRGRLVLFNPSEKDLCCRIRFANPTNPELPEVWDLTLEGPGTKILFDLWHLFPLEPFYSLDDPRRPGPSASVELIVLAGEIRLTHDRQTSRMKGPRGPAALAEWSSRSGQLVKKPLDGVPEWAKEDPALPPTLPAAVREQLSKVLPALFKARDHLVQALRQNPEHVDVVLAECLKQGTSFQDRLLVLRAYAALDEVASLLDALEDEKTDEIRQAAVVCLRYWIATGRDQEKRLFQVLRTKGYTQAEANSLLHLLHGLTPDDLRRRATYELLISYLDHPRIALRELAALHLQSVASLVNVNVPYSASAPALERRQAQNRWEQLLQNGKLPPTFAAPAPMPPAGP